MTLSRKRCSICGLEVEPSINVCPADGSTIDDPFENDPIFQERFEFLESIGAGGMGVIYKARHLILNKIIAIKMVHSHLVSPQAIQRFQVEGKAASHLCHPYIITVHDFGTTRSGQPFMVMDYLTGLSLSQVLAKEGQLDKERFLRIFLQTTDALAHAHSRGVVHRDIKPANIMLVTGAHGEEEVRIMDFGLAKIVDDTEQAARHLTKTGVAMGSPYYMSPEQARGTRVDHRSDLYSLGCTMYEALTGSPPFEGKTPFETMLMHLNDAPATLKEASLGKDFDPRLQKIIDQLLEKSLEFRYQSMDELHADLLSLQNEAALPAAPEKGKKNTLKVAVLSAAAIAALALAAMVGFKVLAPHSAAPVATTDAGAAPAKPPVQFVTEHGKSQAPSTISPEQTASAPKDETSLSSDELDKALSIETRIEQKARRAKGPLNFSRANFGVDISDQALASIQDSVSVTELNLSGQPIHDDGLACLKKLPIEKLDLASTYVETLLPLRNQTDLVELCVDRSHLNGKGLETIGHLHNLQTLSLSGLKNIKDSDLCSLYTLQHLQKLNLTGCTNLSTKAVQKLEDKLSAACRVAFVGVPLSATASDSVAYKEGMDLLNIKMDPIRAGEKFNRASIELKNSPDRALYAECLWRTGDCKRATDLPMAANMYDAAVTVLKEIAPDSEQLGVVYTNLAFVKEQLNLQEEAISMRESADRVFKKARVKAEDKTALKKLESSNLFALSFTLAAQQLPQKALQALEDGLSVAKRAKLDLADQEAACRQRIGQSFSTQKDFRSALDCFRQALSYYRSHPSPTAPAKISQLKRQLETANMAIGRRTEAVRLSPGSTNN